MDEAPRDPRNCNCGKPVGKPQRMRVQNGRILYLGERGQTVRSEPAPPAPPPEPETAR